MDWPTVSLLLGLLVPITVAMIKFIPPRGGNGNHNGMRTEVAVLKTRYESFSREVDQLRKDIKSLNGKLETLRETIVEIIRQDRL